MSDELPSWWRERIVANVAAKKPSRLARVCGGFYTTSSPLGILSHGDCAQLAHDITRVCGGDDPETDFVRREVRRSR